MKVVTKILSLFLCCVLLAAFAPLAHAEDILLEEVSAFYTVPTAGEAFDYDSITVPDGAHYTAEIAGIYAQTIQSEALPRDHIVVDGFWYFVSVRFIPESGYAIDLNQTVFYINNSDAAVVLNLQLPVDSFIAGSNTPSEQDWDLVFFGRFVYDDLWSLMCDAVRNDPLLLVQIVLLIPLMPILQIYEWTANLVTIIWDRIFYRT